MSEFEDRLNSILSSPEQMSKIMGIAQNFMSHGEEKREQSAPKAQDGGFSLQGLDPKMLTILSRLMGELNGSDEKSELIRSMKPFLNEKKHHRLEKALEITKLAHAARIAMSEFGGNKSNV